MILKIFSIKDNMAEAFIPPFFLPKVAMAVRTFNDMLQDPKHQFSKHPEDYYLFHLGELDDQTGVITPSVEPWVIVRGDEQIKQPLALEQHQFDTEDEVVAARNGRNA